MQFKAVWHLISQKAACLYEGKNFVIARHVTLVDPPKDVSPVKLGCTYVSS